MNGFNGISGLLELLAAELDISRTAYEDATSKYKAVGDWLNRPESNLSEYRPIIYPQGSINLGTVVKPYGDEDQYDIDLVCEILRSKSDISQAKLKELVGAEVRAYTKAHDMTNPADEGRRCWTLEYAASAQFHMDILPCIPDAQGFQSLLEQHHAGIEVLHRYAIAITDNTHPNYRVLSEIGLKAIREDMRSGLSRK